jgi:hypothetical protein
MKVIRINFYQFFIFFILFNINVINIISQKKQEKPINIKVIPSKTNKLTLDDLDEIKMEVLHDMNSQLKDLEDELAEKERMKEKSSSTWSITVNINFYIYSFRAPLFLFQEIHKFLHQKSSRKVKHIQLRKLKLNKHC